MSTAHSMVHVIMSTSADKKRFEIRFIEDSTHMRFKNGELDTLKPPTISCRRRSAAHYRLAAVTEVQPSTCFTYCMNHIRDWRPALNPYQSVPVRSHTDAAGVACAEGVCITVTPASASRPSDGPGGMGICCSSPLQMSAEDPGGVRIWTGVIRSMGRDGDSPFLIAGWGGGRLTLAAGAVAGCPSLLSIAALLLETLPLSLLLLPLVLWPSLPLLTPDGIASSRTSAVISGKSFLRTPALRPSSPAASAAPARGEPTCAWLHLWCCDGSSACVRACSFAAPTKRGLSAAAGSTDGTALCRYRRMLPASAGA